MGSQGGHTCSAADVEHFAFGVEVDVKLAVRTGDFHFVAGFAAKDVGGALAWRDVHPTVALAIPRRGGDADVEHNDIALGGVVGHGVSAKDGLFVDHLKRPQVVLIPFGLEFVGAFVVFGMCCDVDVFEVDGYRRYVDLDVVACLEFEFFAFGKFDDEFFDEGGDVVVGEDFAFPFFDAEYFGWHFDFEVLAHFDLAGEADVFLYFFAGEVIEFGGQHIASTLEYLTATHGTGAATATS